MSEAVGAIAALWRFPVKSMPGEPLDQAEVTERGVVGDRTHRERSRPALADEPLGHRPESGPRLFIVLPGSPHP